MRRDSTMGIGTAIAVIAGLTAFACAPDFEVAVFHFARHPDFPRNDFLNGQLGILQPTFARSYLVIAYRYLSDHRLSAGEKEQVRDYWKDRGTREWDRTGIDWKSRWIKARNRIAPMKIDLDNDDDLATGPFGYNSQTHSFFVNCAEDAYRTAFRTLDSRTQRFGAKNRVVQEWLL